MKKKVLLTSIATIALCLCLIAGSTFALFTSTSNVNIAVTAGKVNMVAGIAITSVESVTGSTTGTVTDENGATYDWTHSDTDAPFNFINGGSAEVTGSVLTIDKITPGDRINLAVSGKNNSNVAIKYRYIVECISGYKLMDGLVVEVGGGTYESLASYTSDWAELAAETDMNTENITITLPVNAGNEYQEQETEIKVTVEAVQGNGVVENESNPVVYIPKVTDATALADALADPEIPAINILADIPTTVEVNGLSNKTIWANGNVVEFEVTGALENVTVDGIADNGDSVPAVKLTGATGDITISNSELFDHNSTPYGAVAGGSQDLAITIDSCEISGARPVYHSGPIKSLEIRNTFFKDSTSWAVQYNNEISENVIIDGCEFYNCTGLLKALKAVGSFTFTNNEIHNCVTKKSDRLGVGVYIDLQVRGDILVEGNVLYANDEVIDDDVTADDLIGVTKVQ